MSQRLETDIVLNLAGNLAAKAHSYGNSMSTFARKNKRAMTLIQTSTAAAGRGIDRFGNRYVGMASAFATGATVKNVAAFESQMTRIGTNAKLSSEQVESLTKSVEDIANQKDIRLDTSLLASGVNEILGKTGDFSYLLDNLENVGLFMQAFNVDAKSASSMFQQFREKGVQGTEEVSNMMDRFYGQFAIGSVSVEEMAGVSNKLFSIYQGKGPEALAQMGALLQIFAKTKGSAEESVTSIEAVFRAFDDKKKVEILNSKGVEVFKKGTTELREPVELLLEVLDLAENDSMKLGEVFDGTALGGLRSLFPEENKQLLLEMIHGTVELGATQKASAKNAATFDSAMTSLNNSFNKFANQRLADPIKDIADAINSVDDESIQSWLDWGETAIWAIGGVVAAKKGIDLLNAGRRAFGGKGGGKGGLTDLGAQPVYVVNMPSGGFGGDALSSGGLDTPTKKGPKGFKRTPKIPKGLKAGLGAMGAFGLLMSVKDYDPNNTTFKPYNFNIADKHPLDSKKSASAAEAYAAIYGNNTPSDFATAGQRQDNVARLQIEVSDDRIKVNQKFTSPSLQVDMDNGPN